METIVIEAVSDKFKNKYSAGSILAGGKWMQVSAKLNLTDFQKDSQVTVETKTNDKGYTSIVGLVNAFPKEQVKEVSKETQTEAKTKTSKRVVKEEVSKPSYDDIKSRKILVQGLTQAVAQAPGLAGLPFTDAKAFIELVKEVSLELINFVDSESK